METRLKIIVALDGMSEEKALVIAKKLSGNVWGYKINDLLYEGFLKKLARHGRVFADVKLHDIPNTVANSVRRLSRMGADMITVHAAGGKEMMRSAVRARGRSKIIAVTVLTSQARHADAFKKILRDARVSGVQGVVCSAHELPVRNILTVVPGIRPVWYTKKDDQQRTATPKQAVALGADYLVIGRPITRAREPLRTLERVVDDIIVP